MKKLSKEVQGNVIGARQLRGATAGIWVVILNPQPSPWSRSATDPEPAPWLYLANPEPSPW